MKYGTLILWLVIAPLTAAAAPNSPQRALTLALSSIDRPPTKAELLKATPEAARILAEMARAPTTLPWHRDRALAALGHFPSPQTRAALLSVLGDEAAGELVQSRALLALATAFSDGSLPEIAPYIDGPSQVLRDTAAQALLQISTPAAREGLARVPRDRIDPSLAQRVRKVLGARRP